MKTVLFQREFLRFQGGHLKVWHYFNHVAAAPGFEAVVRFRPETVWDDTQPVAPRPRSRAVVDGPGRSRHPVRRRPRLALAGA